jgi:hypothetical protein
MGFWNRLANGGLGNSGGIKGLFEEVSENVTKATKNINADTFKYTTGIPPKVIEKHISKSKQGNKFATSPAFGAVVYCELGFGTMDHSGIYVGSSQIIHLEGSGHIRKVGLKGFTAHITTFNPEIWFPCDADSGHAIGFGFAGERALKMLGERRDYNLILDNCHQFSSGCVTSDFENADNFRWTLKHTVEQEYDGNVIWRQWKWF